MSCSEEQAILYHSCIPLACSTSWIQWIVVSISFPVKVFTSLQICTTCEASVGQTHRHLHGHMHQLVYSQKPIRKQNCGLATAHYIRTYIVLAQFCTNAHCHHWKKGLSIPQYTMQHTSRIPLVSLHSSATLCSKVQLVVYH